MGRLGKTVREDQGLAYYTGSRVSGGMGPGPWQVSSGVNPSNVNLAVQSILGEIERITSELVSEHRQQSSPPCATVIPAHLFSFFACMVIPQGEMGDEARLHGDDRIGFSTR